MADDRNNSQGFVGQAHAVEHAPSAPASAAASSRPAGGRENSPPRGPRTLLLRRGDNGFGFTLRHFIVYPPESCCMLPGHERTKIDEPMDTIFVKQVRGSSPAAEAGLRTGDRVVSVDGKPTRGEQYASVVQRIQQAGPWLRLLVVSKEDDILQRYFGETAHNPETNQRPRLRSPERSSQRQRRSVSMIPGLSPRSRQSWVCTMPNSDSERPTDTGYRDDSRKDGQLVNSPPSQQHSPNVTLQRRPLQETSVQLYDSVDDKARTKKQQPYSKDTSNSTRSAGDARFDLYDRTRPESIYSRPSSEQIYDKIKDPIYERVRVGETPRPSSDEKQQLGLLRFPMSRAEPQVPIYRPGRRVTSRRASEGSGTGNTTHDSEIGVYGSTDALKSSEVGSRLSIDSRRDSSSIGRDSPSTYDSSSTLTGNGNGNDVRLTAGLSANGQKGNGSRNGSNSEIIDDSVIMMRLRKSFEQKEEFLRRPSHPIGFFLPEETSDSSNRSSTTAAPAVIPREFYARPQKLQRQIWPPGEQRSPTRRSSQEKIAVSGKFPMTKPTNQSVQRVKTDAGSESESTNPREQHLEEKSGPASLDSNQTARERFYTSHFDERQDNSSSKSPSDRQLRAAGKSTFVGTLSRIHENITSAAALLASDNKQPHESRNGCSSLPSSPGPDKKTNDKFPTLPQGLQIVSKRAKQFESGRLLSDDDEPTGDRTSLYKSELSRLSNKRSVPNVAVRKREFESKAEAQEPRRIPATRETKSLDTGGLLSGNRVIPIGSKYIHCEPPGVYRIPEGITVGEEEAVRPRARSNSVESWETATGSRKSGSHSWQLRQDESELRQDEEDDPPSGARSIDAGETDDDRNKKQGSYPQVIGSDAGSHGNGVVFRRQKNAQTSDEDRATRRVSYLKATWGERMHVDSDLDLSDSEPVHVLRSLHKRWRPPLFPSDITPLRRIFEDMTQAASLNRSSHRDSTGSGQEAPCNVPATGNAVSTSTSRDVEPVEREGCLHIKFTVLDGKRSTDRSWKQVWGVLRGPILHFYKDRHNQSPSLSTDSENTGQFVDVRCSLVDIAEDYTKRKHVLRLANPNAEVLLQTEDAASMALWLRSLHEHAAAEKPSDATCSTSKQQAVPQAPGPTTSSSSSTTVPGSAQRLSPVPGHKGIKKLTSFRNRSPTGQSPVNKTRKPSQSVETLPSPKTKTWKGRVAKQLRRMHGQAGSPSSPTAQLPPEGATFKVPLELCPPSSFSESVPLIVEMCTSIVEARGLEVIGIYRVPGNTAAISQLTDSVNKGFEHINLQDPRWSDVNVISSLLKSFFRQLPDSLLTAELYPMFIDADKVEDPQRRMTTIRKLLRDLPEHHFETLKYLMFHLKRIVDHSEVNKMEAKNLAIVFGPTLVRASGSRDNMVTMVTDMSHQCRIVESLLNNVDWFFSDDDLDDLSRLSVNLSLPADGSELETTSNTNHNLLLSNIQKVEGTREMASARDIVSSIISAANRKIQRRRKGQDETDNDSHHETEKLKAKQEAENLAALRRSMALNERQCSVSEIVLMHENKSQNRSTDRSPTIDANVGSVGSISVKDDASMESASSNRSKYSKQATLPLLPIQRSAVSSASESSRLSSETGLSCYDASSTLSSTSNETKQSNDEVTIRTYAGLSASTQERIRRFEQETKAMLQRDQNRQRREAEKREEEKRRIEMEWQLAKREMENDDLLDSIVDTTVAPGSYLSGNRLSTLEDRLGDKSYLDLSSRSTARTPLSIAVQQQPTNGRRVTQHSDETTGTLLENLNNAVIKKLKTEKEEPSSLPPVRYGSLDSLHESHDLSQSSISPSQPRKPLPGDTSDDGSDLLTSITNTFDRKWRSLVNPMGGQGVRTSAGSSSFSGNDEENEAEEGESRAERKKAEEGAECGTEDNPGQRRKEKPSNVSTVESYRDPSLHKTWLGKSHLTRQKNDAPEKDTDSSIAESAANQAGANVPDNDRSAIAKKKLESRTEELPEADPLAIAAGERKQESAKLEDGTNKENEDTTSKPEEPLDRRYEVDSSYSNKLERFESLTNSEVRSRLKRSESLNKRSESASTKLKRSESLNKHSSERLSSPTNGKLKRSESLNKHSERSDSPNSKLKRSESLTKTEKTECNISKRRQSVRKDSATKLKRKNGMPERSIKRRHTVGGTKDFDKVHWLDNKLQSEAERVVRNDYRPKKSQLRTSSPDLSTGRMGIPDASFLIEVSFRGPSNVVFNVTNTRPQSLPDASLASKVFKVPLESHV